MKFVYFICLFIDVNSIGLFMDYIAIKDIVHINDNERQLIPENEIKSRGCKIIFFYLMGGIGALITLASIIYNYATGDNNSVVGLITTSIQSLITIFYIFNLKNLQAFLRYLGVVYIWIINLLLYVSFVLELDLYKYLSSNNEENFLGLPIILGSFLNWFGLLFYLLFRYTKFTSCQICRIICDLCIIL
jgi:hypothetical protein